MRMEGIMWKIGFNFFFRLSSILNGAKSRGHSRLPDRVGSRRKDKETRKDMPRNGPQPQTEWKTHSPLQEERVLAFSTAHTDSNTLEADLLEAAKPGDLPCIFFLGLGLFF